MESRKKLKRNIWISMLLFAMLLMIGMPQTAEARTLLNYVGTDGIFFMPWVKDVNRDGERPVYYADQTYKPFIIEFNGKQITVDMPILTANVYGKEPYQYYEMESYTYLTDSYGTGDPWCIKILSMPTPAGYETAFSGQPEFRHLSYPVIPAKKDADGRCIQGYTDCLIPLVKVGEKMDLSKINTYGSIQFVDDFPIYDYTGKPVQPKIDVFFNARLALTQGKDYTVSYENNINAGTAKVVVNGIGKCTGRLERTFRIRESGSSSGTVERPSVTPPESTNYQFKLKLNKKSFTYTGKARKPEIKVYVNGKKIKGSQYTVTYKNNKKIGTATVTVKGKGKYKKYVGTTTYKIVPDKTTLSRVKSSQKGKLSLKWKTSKGQGYQIQYSTGKKFASGTKVKNVSGQKKTSVTLKGLKSKKKYYVRIRTYQKVDGQIWYSDWSKAGKVKIK